MPDQISISKTLSIRDCGFDEYWLQDQIAANPACLDLGDLEIVRREKLQSSGGRLDMLLKNPEDDTMYEVEVMLGATNETHIIRTIEYWDLERKRWLQRQHFAVLVAETITRRFFDVIQLLSLSIPVIAVQANMIVANAQKVLHFTKILNAYEEPEDDVGASNETCDEAWWRTKSISTVEASRTLQKILAPVYGQVDLRFAKGYVALNTGGYNQFWLEGRTGNKSLLSIWFDESCVEDACKLLNQDGFPYRRNRTNKRGWTRLLLNVSSKDVEEHSDLMQKLAAFVKKCYLDESTVILN
jgi:hypothetical protein